MASKRKRNFQKKKKSWIENIELLHFNDEIFFQSLMPFVSNLELDEKLEYRMKLLQLAQEYLYPEKCQLKIKSEPLQSHENDLPDRDSMLFFPPVKKERNIKEERKINEQKEQEEKKKVKQEKQEKQVKNQEDFLRAPDPKAYFVPMVQPMMQGTMYSPMIYPSMNMQFTINPYAKGINTNEENSTCVKVKNEEKKSSVIITEVLEVVEVSDDDVIECNP